MDKNREILREIGRKAKDGLLTWEQAAKEYTEKTGETIKGENFRGRYRNLHDGYDGVRQEVIQHPEQETHYEDGSVSFDKLFWFDPNEKKDANIVLKGFGYDPSDWEVISWSFTRWEMPMRDEDTNRECYRVSAKLKPITKKELSTEQYIEVARDVFKSEIKPIKLDKKKVDKSLNPDKMLELTGIELHLGKLAFDAVTGQNYNSDVAKQRFYKILYDVLEQQDIEKCDTCLICIGNDFLNSDTTGNTTTKGTQQFNDVHWKVLFNMALEMYTTFILTLRDKFNHVEVRLQQGNHDYMSSFYLYTALSCYFNNDSIIKFSSDVKDVQCFEWGRCAIFFTHGDSNLKRLIKSIPAEFYDTWGRTIYRELHLGHLHCEQVVDDSSGLVTRRVGSPTGTDDWHYRERFIGATQKYQTFVWDKNEGLLNVKYITFGNTEQNKVRKRVR